LPDIRFWEKIHIKLSGLMVSTLPYVDR